MNVMIKIRILKLLNRLFRKSKLLVIKDAKRFAKEKLPWLMTRIIRAGRRVVEK